MSADEAFRVVLATVDARAVRIGERMYRIEAAPRAITAAPRPIPILPTAQLSDIVVTAVPPVGDQTPVGRSLVDSGALDRAEGAVASEAIADLSATVDSTRQGTGRNKLFVRGLADSAMNGPLQSTVGQYFGDLRLSYGSPDPDLVLVDMRRIEVFEGPQGTRFGVGAIGGILRLQPEPPAFDETTGRLIAGVGATSGGAMGGDVSLVANRPFGDNAAGRMVVYARREGGYLDNPVLGEKAVDGVETVGARGALRWTTGAWTIDLDILAQQTSAEDSQTTSRPAIGFTRLGQVAEPYESDVVLSGVTARRTFAWGALSSATSVSRQSLVERFDATQPADDNASFVDRSQTALSVSSELRVDTAPRNGWTWSGGVAVAAGETLAERRRQEVDAAPTSAYGVDLTRTYAEATVFAEAAFSPAPNWSIAAGTRLSLVRIDTDIRAVSMATRQGGDLDGATFQLSPSLSARWNVSDQVTLFGRLERAVRPAGVSEADGAFGRYRGDRVTLTEIGARTRRPHRGLSGEVSAGWVDWRDVQADIVTQGGDLVTDNVGDGVICFISARGAWTPVPTLDLTGGVFVNASRLTSTRFSVIGGSRTDIPNVAPIGAQLSADYQAGRLFGEPLRLGADLRYVGQSRLGVGPMLDVPQGGYLRTELSARLGDERRSATLRISNPFDTKGVRYGIGSPYQLSELQAVPVRPLTVRLSLETAF